MFFLHLFNISNSNFFSLLISSVVKRHYVDKEKMWFRSTCLQMYHESLWIWQYSIKTTCLHGVGRKPSIENVLWDLVLDIYIVLVTCFCWLHGIVCSHVHTMFPLCQMLASLSFIVWYWDTSTLCRHNLTRARTVHQSYHHDDCL